MAETLRQRTSARRTRRRPAPAQTERIEGDLVAGDSAAGDSVAGDSVAGDQVAGDKLAGDKIETQINTGGGASAGPVNTGGGDFIGRDKKITIYKDGRINWRKVQFTAYLASVQREFIRAIQERSASGVTDRQAAGLYVPPLLSCRRTQRGTEQDAHYTDVKSSQGTWDELVRYPCLGLVVGDAYDGKSLLLRKVANDLADPALGKRKLLPIYVPLADLHGLDLDDVLQAAALACGQETDVLRAVWNDERRPICLLIDDVDNLPAEGRDRFVATLADLNQRRKGHSLIVACQPGSLREKIAHALSADPLFAELVILPLTDAQIDDLLRRYGAPATLAPMIHSNATLKRLVSRPGLLSALVRAAKRLPLVAVPKSMAELYRLLVDEHLFAPDKSNYQYRRVKRPILGYLAYRMLCGQQSSLAVDDALYAEIAERMADFYRRYDRSARPMPPDWSAAALIEELQKSPVMNPEAAQQERVEFASSIYRDYYAALHLTGVDQDWPQVAEAIQQSSLEGWMDALMLLTGMPTSDATNSLVDAVLAAQPCLAADLWLEKSTLGVNRAPACIAADYGKRLPFVPTDEHPAQPYLAKLLAGSDPRASLDAVGALLQLGAGAIEPLLDASEANHPLVQATAIHALLHLGEFAAYPKDAAAPLLVMAGQAMSFRNQGAGNAVLGPLRLVAVPRTFRAELNAHIDQVDFDPFDAPSQFELWHTPVAWFALDYFNRAGRVDWIGLAGACSVVARCASLVIEQASARPKLAPIVNELTQCLISYDRLGFRIASDLGLPWEPIASTPEMEWLTRTADQVYGEVRLFFSRASRPRMLSMLRESEQPPAGPGEASVSQAVQRVAGKVQAIAVDQVDLASDRRQEIVDVPSTTRIAYAQTIESVAGGQVAGISIGRVTPGRYLAAETLSLRGNLAVGQCAAAQIEGITIKELSRWNGIRAKLSMSIGRLENSQVIGIQATPSPEVVQAEETGG